MINSLSSVLLAHPTGNANVRAAAEALYQAGWLHQFHSCICWNSQSTLAKLLPSSLRLELQRRSFPSIPYHLQHSHPWRELARLSIPPSEFLKRHEIGPLSIDAVYRGFDKHVASLLAGLSSLKVVYCYEDGALDTFLSAQSLGVGRIYDLPIGYWRAARHLFNEEKSLNPDWACTLTGLKDSPAKLSRKDHELQLSDLVIVPSNFVRSTLLEFAASPSPISVIPFGSPPPVDRPKTTTHDGPLRVLYVGSLGQRKGLSYLLDAINQLGSAVELTLIGKPVSQECRPLLAALQTHRWYSSIPHPEVLKLMREHDVLVLPSLFEGYALVISEALSQGLPVIATPNSGATESIRHGIEGYIVPIRDSLAIERSLQMLIDCPDLILSMSRACLARSAELSWATYQNALVNAVRPFIVS